MSVADTQSSQDPTIKKIGDQVRRRPEQRILNALTVSDISTLVKDDYALIIVLAMNVASTTMILYN